MTRKLKRERRKSKQDELRMTEDHAEVERANEPEDLDVDPDAAARVTGGVTADPCEGGEVSARPRP